MFMMYWIYVFLPMEIDDVTHCVVHAATINLEENLDDLEMLTFNTKSDLIE